ncbi:ComF family protein [Bordetella sp. FB-8]|uniref:ComF family protein n=1 Tax=Bordetella sp. FB-8 TaxID=1159870 RepID=UPI0003628846|nr:phosphoribosyltransferase family protein [Bordetella sp. FB-8]
MACGKVCAALARIIPHSCVAAWAAVRRGLPRFVRSLLAGVGSSCPACDGAARAGLLCAACAQAVLEQATARRCPRCALRLGATQAGRRGGLCVECALHPPAFAHAVAAFDYADPFDALIKRYKGARRHIVSSALAQSLVQAVRTVHAGRAAGSADRADPAASAGPDAERLPIDVVVPVPASRASLRQRGFNPAGELARGVALRLQLRLLRGVLRRRHEGVARQASLARPDREAAALDAYVCAQRLDGLRVALVDDVMTTGSTADAAARALLAAGAASVTVWVAARTPKPL